ncbi:FAD-dependent oxidoreductase [Streptomyces sp. TRM 70351]|uniref:FAD-dependent oxidoreductase n=1 Tax=Streptomyces sp. TRM 70351 TaxID=3116552 RepID=UPI002E7AD2E8|nr:FAD-dependent oxidoreductase [Streptomyces sp. TRM 70351]MEE1928649.1 FAD-dependent oxidoreductase [Streptomyces sp. TRM 70351]
MLGTAPIRRTDTADVVVVGAGLAGLAAAHELAGAGLAVTVVEAADAVGGRMATTDADGYRLDHGAHLLCADWPELNRFPAFAALTLRPFAPGAVVRGTERTVRLGGARALRPGAGGAAGGGTGSTGGSARHTARSLGTALDAARLRAQLARLAATAPERLLARPEQPAARAWAARGVPSRTVGTLLRPLVAALTADPGLTTSSRVVDLALRGFARRGLALPAGGASTLPGLLAAALPRGTVRTGVRAVAVSANAVETDGGGTLGCRAVLIATGARDAAALLPGVRVPRYHPVTVLHHAADAAPPPADPALVLDGDRRGPVTHTAVASAVDPSRTPPGRTLVTSVVLGANALAPPGVLDEAVRPQLGALYGVDARRWELLAVHHEPHAVPAMPAPHDARRPVRVLTGLYLCGDHRDTGTPQGALRSALRAAEAVRRDFGVPACPRPVLRAA